MPEVFEKLKGAREIMIDSDLGSSYLISQARKEFAILYDQGDKIHLVHPYGTRVGYFIFRSLRKD